MMINGIHVGCAWVALMLLIGNPGLTYAQPLSANEPTVNPKLLEGKVVVVGGGSGQVGGGIVRALLEAGAITIVPSRSEAKLKVLTEAMADIKSGQLVTHQVDTASIPALDAFRDEILKRYGHLDAAIASLGPGRWTGPITEIEFETWNEVLRNNLTSHFLFARTFVQALDKNGAYLMINGGTARWPIPGAGPMSITSAAQEMLGRVLDAENHPRGVRIHTLLIASHVVAHWRGWSELIPPAGPSELEVGRIAAWIISDAGALTAGSVVTIPLNIKE